MKREDLQKLKRFSNLEFGPHPSGAGISAFMSFENGTSISVIQGEKFHSTPGISYEVQVVTPDTDPWGNDGIIGWASSGEITDIMIILQTKY